MTDRELIEWVANAKPGDKVPTEYADAPGGVSVVVRLVELGVMDEPARARPMYLVAAEATRAARAWLAEHPLDGVS